MKKLLLPIMLMLGYLAQAQVPLLTEDFPIGLALSKYNVGDLTIPATTKLFRSTTTNWTAQFGAGLPGEASGTAVFESRFNSAGTALTDDAMAEDAYMISKTPFSTTGQNTVFFSITHALLTPSGVSVNHTASVEFSTDSTTWTSIFSNTTGYYGTQRVKVPAAFANQAKVYMRVRYQGNFSGLWVIDQISVYGPAKSDVEMVYINNKTTVSAPCTLVAAVNNWGADTITSLELSYTVNGGAPVTATTTGLSIAPLTGGMVSHTVPWNSAPGFYTIVMTTGKANNIADASTTNNSSTKKMILAGATTIAHRPLFEIFTSSTCPPCNPGNAKFLSVVSSYPASDYTAIKYQQFGPGTGDPYCTNECQKRYGYYYPSALAGGYSIPYMTIDGGWGGNANSFTSALYDDAKALPAVYDLSGEFMFDTASKTIDVKVKHSPLFDMPSGGIKLYVAVVESITTKNVKTNGETEFYDVMKKMLPDDVGITMTSLTANSKDSSILSFQFVGSYRLPSNGQTANRIDHTKEHSIENWNNLKVIAWTQHTATKSILQSVSLTKKKKAVTFGIGINNVEITNSINVSPSPATEFANLNFNTSNANDIQVAVINNLGENVMNMNHSATVGANSIPMNISTLANGNYIVRVSANGEVVASSKFVVSK